MKGTLLLCNLETKLLWSFSMKKTKVLFSGLVLGAFLSLGLISGCEDKGPVEEFGEKVDEAANDAKRKIEDATD